MTAKFIGWAEQNLIDKRNTNMKYEFLILCQFDFDKLYAAVYNYKTNIIKQ